MSLYCWILSKEIIFEKVKKEVVKIFLAEKEKESDYEGKILVRFQFDDLIDIIAKNLNVKKNTVNNHIMTLLGDYFISIASTEDIFYYHDLPDDLKKCVYYPAIDPLDPTSIIQLHLKNLIRIENEAELEIETKELNETSIDLDLEEDEDIW